MLLRNLQKRGVVDHTASSGLKELIMAGNQAAHGIEVEPSVADSVLDFGPRIISALDHLIAKFER